MNACLGPSRSVQRGVTLMELLMVVTVVAILATTAVVSYRQYALRAGRSEAKVALMQAQQNLERCFTRFSRYVVAAGLCPTYDALSGDGVPSAEGRYLVTGTFDEDAVTYELTAAPAAGGGMEDDAKCGSFIVRSDGTRTTDPAADAAECWR